MTTHDLHLRHERQFQTNRFVYPVLSRRARGISIGVNLNPDKVCNFHCVYCQVDRTQQAESDFVETDALLRELEEMLRLVSSGEIYETPKFRDTPPHLRHLHDIAFSGDGEPTNYRNFDELLAASAAVKRRCKLDKVKMVLITNASMFHRPRVERGLKVLDANNGEIWAKLDAGTEAFYQQIARTSIPFERILQNITEAAKIRPIVIQSLFLRMNGVPPSPAEQAAYCNRLNEIQAADGKIRLVQLYTIARPPAEANVTPLSNAELANVVKEVQSKTGLEVAGFPGTAS